MTFPEPRRTRVPELRALVRDAPDSAAAWHALIAAGELPAAWRDDARRRFVDPAARYPAYAPTTPVPASIDECVLVAADVSGIMRAEAAAALFAERLAPWGAPAFDHVRWWSLSRSRYDYARSDTQPDINYGLGLAITDAIHQILRIAGDKIGTLGDAAAWADAWSQGQDAQNPLPPNPFEPLAEIEAAGYVSMEYVTNDGGVVLVLPVADELDNYRTSSQPSTLR